MSTQPLVLVADDDPGSAASVAELVRILGHELNRCVQELHVVRVEEQQQAEAALSFLLGGAVADQLVVRLVDAASERVRLHYHVKRMAADYAELLRASPRTSFPS